MDGDDVERWFGDYLEAYAACGRGERYVASMLAFYGVPLLITTGTGYFPLIGDEQVVAGIQPQIDAMRAASYDHTETLGLEVTMVNGTSALVRGTFSWRRADRGEIQRLTVTYLVTDGAAGRRISMLAVHG
ncbi:hypothetical protein ACQP2F_20830 [Actinoplanes sp. CA-030573]|uniref:DUF6841 family protein n=1 Tax=Actinoplanes sp. CA-030573 TaxID=3239898 RepID=UPI003D8D44DD